MASLRQAKELITAQLREQVDELESAIEDDAPDFARITRLADAVGELADLIGATYHDLEQTLMSRLQGDAGSENGKRESRQARKEEPRGEQHSQTAQNDRTAEDVIKEELLERARESNIHGRSAMSKKELARAVEAEESLTKEELLERAREADIEGRSSMTKDELRKAVNEAGA